MIGTPMNTPTPHVYIPPYMKRMIDHIYLSDRRSIIDYDKFDLVVNLDYPNNGVHEGDYVEEQFTPKTKLIRIGMKDDDQSNIRPYLDQLIRTLKEYTARHQMVLIHSDRGMGRTTVVMSAYLIKQYRFGLGDISHIYQSSAYHPDLNKGFSQQLQDLYQDKK